MTRIRGLQLDDNWHCEYFELEPSLYEFMRGIPVASLNEWSFDRRRVEGWVAWLQRTFTLESTDFCVNYLLFIDSAPDGARIYINGQQVGVYHTPGDDDPPFEMDVTLYVALGQNTLALRVEGRASGHFSGLSLQPVPCA